MPQPVRPREQSRLDRLETPVRELMRPGVVTVAEDASIRQAARALLEHRQDAVLVLGRATGVPLGWVTRRGLLGLLDLDWGAHPAGDAITERAVVVEPYAPARAALDMLLNERVGRALVALGSDHSAQGTIGELDLVRLFVQ